MVVPSPELHVYARDVDVNERTSLAVLAGQIPAGARVLDLGCGTGAIGRFLVERDGAAAGPVDGVTVSADEARLAAPHYRRVEVADLDTCDLLALFQRGSFDIIVCADVLEHLRTPEHVLNQCRELLTTTGRALLSVPNTGYCGLIAELIAGEFRYRTEGLLDRTHLRFFTRNTLLRFLADNRWIAEDCQTVQRQLPDSEFRVDFDALPPAVARYLLALPDALSYQFIIATRPALPGEKIENPEVDVQLPAHALFTSQLYWRANGRYDEDQKITTAGIIGTERQQLVFQLPADRPLSGLRFDPADRPGFLYLYALALRDAGGSVLWHWDQRDPFSLLSASREGIEVHHSWWTGTPFLLLLHGTDPWIDLPIPPQALAQAGGGYLVAEAGWPMSADYLSLANVARQGIADARKAADQARQQALGLSAEIEKAERQLIHVTARNTELRKQNSALLTQTNALIQERNRAAQERNAAHALIQSIEQSTVFRATRPIVHAKMRIDRLLGIGSAHKPAASALQPVRMPLAPPDRPVDIIVPVYKGLSDTQRCIDSVLASRNQTSWRLIIINDASPEPQVTAWLRQRAATDPRIELLENEHNLGFVGTVNRGMAHSADHDVLLLNSDTEVANDWLDRIRAAAYSDREVATVTPFSNNATICSYPRFCEANALPPGWDLARLDKLFAGVNAGQVVDVPTGVGFCMYIRRAALLSIGLFDEDNFGRGYGEENDFCIRAAAGGWRNVHLLDTFVLHSGGVSFGAEKSPRERAAMETLRRLHPRYEAAVMDFIQRDPARLARVAVDIARLVELPHPVILAVVHNLGGGTERHVQELAHALCERACTLILKPAPGQRVALSLPGPQEALNLTFELPREGEALLALLRQLGVAHIHYHHLIGHGEFVRQMPSALGVSYDFTAHDYFAMCPRVSLTNHEDCYCGETGAGECTICLDDPTAVDGTSTANWRPHNAQFLQGARYVLAPSLDTLTRLAAWLPAANLQWVPHTDMNPGHPPPTPSPRPMEANRPLKVAVVGALSVIKGANLLEDTAVAAHKLDAPIEFHLIGYGYRPLKTQPRARLTVHGRYDEADLPALLDWLQPDVVWFPAQWPETYSYTLSACLQGGWPVVAPDLGAFRERLQARSWSWVRPWNDEAAQWIEFFTQIRAHHFATGISPAPIASAPLPNVEALPSIDATQGSSWYQHNYLTGLALSPRGESPSREFLALHLDVPASGPINQAKNQTLRLLVRLRGAPLLSGLARRIPARWQSRLKHWLRR